MRIHFQTTPWDLYACVAYTLVIGGLILALGEGDFLALLMILFAPGYVLVSALFPSGARIGWSERIALSVGLSVVVVSLLGFGLNLSSWGIRFVSAVSMVVAFTSLGGFVAWWRRMRLPASERLSATLYFGLSNRVKQSAIDGPLVLTLALSFMLAAGTLAYVAIAPRSTERFTEFFVLGTAGNVSDYPSRLNASQPGAVFIGTINHETMAVSYRVRVELVGLRSITNATTGANATLEVNRTTWSTFNFILADGQNWTQAYVFRIDYTGLWKVQFLLFRDSEFSSAYRELHLYITVA